jgi:hypothetical protein
VNVLFEVTISVNGSEENSVEKIATVVSNKFKDRKVNTFTDLLNLVVWAKNRASVKDCKCILKRCVKELHDLLPTMTEDKAKKLAFICEQIGF